MSGKPYLGQVGRIYDKGGQKYVKVHVFVGFKDELGILVGIPVSADTEQASKRAAPYQDFKL
jgi:hypothetical protein